MRTRIALTPFVPWLFALASCSSPPKPPTVDESQKRPVNSQMAVELQVCRNDLQNTRLLAAESGRLAESTTATLANLAARQQIIAAVQAPADKPPVTTSQVTRVERREEDRRAADDDTAQTQRKEVRILKGIEHDGEGFLLIDDLVDTGNTARVIRKLLPKAYFATLYAKPQGREVVDLCVKQFNQDKWIYFPWDIDYQFVPPIKKHRANP